LAQTQLSSGSSDKTSDCMACIGYSPNGEGVFHCRWMDDIDPPHKCEKCGHCDCFKPITDKEVNSWLMADYMGDVIRKTTFNRYRWVEVEKLRRP